ncbi:hypothetical protein CGZ93_05150 [Enemella dayhoffiae]|uniref:DUF1707 domain-containing protein n=1 Tax=Enemella dayhoffiae TaxID=2016507 RepID=A0A255H9J3_9ACTN|nr:DUF1707 domain-containing protein [Enemella dayhoffiae]OYO23906.1 hypothetical protein CGZ93_05150 [Enemella dayhoffiae]
MSNLPISSKYRSTPNEPVSEQERSQLSTQLNQAFTEGRIDQETYDSLLDEIFSAQRLGDLANAVEVLGKPPTHNAPAIVQQTPSGRPGELAEARGPSTKLTLALVGGVVGAMALLAILLVLLLL